MDFKGYEHWNSPDNLPPVDCPLVILFCGVVWRVERPAHVESKGRQLTYRINETWSIKGRCPWTYP